MKQFEWNQGWNPRIVNAGQEVQWLDNRLAQTNVSTADEISAIPLPKPADEVLPAPLQNVLPKPVENVLPETIQPGKPKKKKNLTKGLVKKKLKAPTKKVAKKTKCISHSFMSKINLPIEVITID